MVAAHALEPTIAFAFSAHNYKLKYLTKKFGFTVYFDELKL